MKLFTGLLPLILTELPLNETQPKTFSQKDRRMSTLFWVTFDNKAEYELQCRHVHLSCDTFLYVGVKGPKEEVCLPLETQSGGVYMHGSWPLT